MNVLVRILGLQLLAELGARLPARYARMVSVALLVLANVVPIVGVATGWLNTGDVLGVYWLENVVVWFFSVIRIATAIGPESKSGEPMGVGGRIFLALFFTFHYGMFTLVHGVFTFLLIGFTMPAGELVDYRAWLWVVAALFVSHLVSLGLYWFARGERRTRAATTAMVMPYLRVVVLHVTVLASFFIIFGVAIRSGGDPFDGPRPGGLVPVLVLVGIKVGIDVVLHLRERSRAAKSPALAFHPESEAIR